MIRAKPITGYPAFSASLPDKANIPPVIIAANPSDRLTFHPANPAMSGKIKAPEKKERDISKALRIDVTFREIRMARNPKIRINNLL